MKINNSHYQFCVGNVRDSKVMTHKMHCRAGNSVASCIWAVTLGETVQGICIIYDINMKLIEFYHMNRVSTAHAMYQLLQETNVDMKIYLKPFLGKFILFMETFSRTIP
jgi:hypothetical protein